MKVKIYSKYILTNYKSMSDTDEHADTDSDDGRNVHFSSASSNSSKDVDQDNDDEEAVSISKKEITDEEDDEDGVFLGTEITTADKYVLKPYTHAQLLDALHSVFELNTAEHSFYNRVEMNRRRDAPQHIQFVFRVYTPGYYSYATFCDMRRFEQNIFKSVDPKPITGTEFHAVMPSKKEAPILKLSPSLCQEEFILASDKQFTPRPGNELSAVENKYSKGHSRTTHLTMAHWNSFAHTQLFSDLQFLFALPLTDSIYDEHDSLQFERQFTDPYKKTDLHKQLTERQKDVIESESFQRVLVFNNFKRFNEHLSIQKHKHRTTVHNPVIRRMLMKIYDVLELRM